MSWFCDFEENNICFFEYLYFLSWIFRVNGWILVQSARHWLEHLHGKVLRHQITSLMILCDTKFSIQSPQLHVNFCIKPDKHQNTPFVWIRLIPSEERWKSETWKTLWKKFTFRSFCFCFFTPCPSVLLLQNSTPSSHPMHNSPYLNFVLLHLFAFTICDKRHFFWKIKQPHLWWKIWLAKQVPGARKL